jgi:hypothetical protein
VAGGGTVAQPGRLQTLRTAASSVAPVDPNMNASCVLALLGFRAASPHPATAADH